MPIYDSSFLTKRMANKTIARDFINRINRQNITSYGPLQGNYDNSILNNVAEGRQQNITKCQVGYQTDNGGGCPCTLSTMPSSSLNILPSNAGQSDWILHLFRYADGTDFTGAAGVGDIVVDSSNNIYVVGFYSTPPGTTQNLRIQNVSAPSQTSSAYTLPFTSTALAQRTFGFIIKYDTNGLVLLATYIGTDISVSIGSISVDSSNDIYINGNYNSTSIVTLKDALGTGQTNSLITLPIVTGSNNNVYTIKYSSSLVAQWGTNFTSGTTALSDIVEVGPDGGIYITGYYQSAAAVTIQSPTFIQSSTSVSAYLIKYSSAGNVVWATIVKGNNNSAYASDIAFYGNYLYLSGPYFANVGNNVTAYDKSGNSQIASAYTLPSSGGIQFAYLIKYTLDGIAQWATNIIDVKYNNSISTICDTSGNIYVLGIYQSATSGVVVAQNGVGLTVTLPATSGANNPNYFIIKYDSNGKVVWGNIINTNDTLFSISGEITIDSSDNIYITGQYKQNSTSLILTDVLGTGQTNSLVTLPATTGSLFIIKYNSSGTTQWATFLSSPAGPNDGITIMIDSSNNLVVGGIVYTDSTNIYAENVNGTSQIQASYYINPNINQVQDGFLVKYS